MFVHELRGVSRRRSCSGSRQGSTRTISIAAYQQAFEQYDMSYASAIAVIMGLCQLAALDRASLLVRRADDDRDDHGRRESGEGLEQ